MRGGSDPLKLWMPGLAQPPRAQATGGFWQCCLYPIRCCPQLAWQAALARIPHRPPDEFTGPSCHQRWRPVMARDRLAGRAVARQAGTTRCVPFGLGGTAGSRAMSGQ